MHEKGISQTSEEKSLSHSADKIRRRTLLCFERILVSMSFKQRRGEASQFCRKFFYLTGPRKFRQGTILCFRKFLVGKNILWIRGGWGVYQDFPSKFFCLTVSKNFAGEPFSVSLISGIEIFYALESYVTIFRRNFLSHSVEKFRR